MVPINYEDDDEEQDTDFELERDPSLTYAMQIGTVDKEPSIFVGKVDGTALCTWPVSQRQWQEEQRCALILMIPASGL